MIRDNNLPYYYIHNSITYVTSVWHIMKVLAAWTKKVLAQLESRFRFVHKSTVWARKISPCFAFHIILCIFIKTFCGAVVLAATKIQNNPV